MFTTHFSVIAGLLFCFLNILTTSHSQTNFRLIPEAIHLIASDKAIPDKTPQFFSGEKIVTKKESYLYAVKESFTDSIVINIYANDRPGMKPNGKLTEACVFIMKNGLPVLDHWLEYPSLPYSKGGYGKNLSTRGICFHDPNQYTLFENGIEKSTYSFRYDNKELRTDKEKKFVLAYKKMDDILSGVKDQNCVINRDLVEVVPATDFWITPNNDWTLFGMDHSGNYQSFIMNNQGDTVIGMSKGFVKFTDHFMYTGNGLDKKMYLFDGTFIAESAICEENFETSELSPLYFMGDSDKAHAFRTCCLESNPIVKTAYVTKTGEIKIPAGDFYGYDFNEGLAAVVNAKNRYGFINTSGELVIPNTYNKVEPFKEGKAKVTLGDRTFYIDKKGNEIN